MVPYLRGGALMRYRVDESCLPRREEALREVARIQRHYPHREVLLHSLECSSALCGIGDTPHLSDCVCAPCIALDAGGPGCECLGRRERNAAAQGRREGAEKGE